MLLRERRNGCTCACCCCCCCCCCCDQVDATDSVDNVCPMMCPGSGRLPECISAAKMTTNLWKCQDTFKFEVRKYSSSK